ncbi:hypothetical protein GTP38_23260 [Duganella sp. FT94W]|uniref:Uncharacterized protein n=1 Tax=Duganella lactea TaxID=2692173 RepID=A0ABW9VC85_9BURK|nr:hypothetical protein [Duganella lactea]MYM37249.1 hypothetical protein [Duganella lactea]
MCDDLKAQVARLHLRPGDTLVISTERVLNREQRDRMREVLGTVLHGVPVLVADGGVRLSVIGRAWLGDRPDIDKVQQAHEATPIKATSSWTFDGWMAERIAKAHAELMAGPAYRGPGCRAG